MLRVYDRSLQWVLRHRGATMAFSTAVLAATVFMFVDIPKGFIPDQDTDQLLAITEAGQGTSFYQMVEYQKQIAEVIRTDPNVDALVSSVGGTAVGDSGRPEFRPVGGAPQAALRAQAAGERCHRRAAAQAFRASQG